jgi:signal transduction histidine kinase
MGHTDHEPTDSPEHLRRELKAARAQVESQQRQVALLAEDRGMFLDNLSHQLRTPLDTILILSGLLETNAEGNLTAKQIEYAAVISRSCADLKSLIDELLTLAQSRP